MGCAVTFINNNKFLFIALFHRQFRLCITKASGKAHTSIQYNTNQQRKQSDIPTSSE